MARYNLIMSDKHYHEIFELATAQKMTIGKYFNAIIIPDHIQNVGTQEPEEPKCAICGNPKVVSHGYTYMNDKLYFCLVHRKYRKICKSFGDIKK